MLKDLKDLKKFVLWCKKNKIKAFKNNDIEFELSELAFIKEDPTEYKEINLSDSKTFADTETLTKEEQDELLFWSSKK